MIHDTELTCPRPCRVNVFCMTFRSSFSWGNQHPTNVFHVSLVPGISYVVESLNITYLIPFHDIDLFATQDDEWKFGP